MGLGDNQPDSDGIDGPNEVTQRNQTYSDCFKCPNEVFTAWTISVQRVAKFRMKGTVDNWDTLISVKASALRDMHLHACISTCAFKVLVHKWLSNWQFCK